MLYHYTSIEALVQILSKKQIKFNSLTNCDDLDEAVSADLGKAGRYVFVSCWTREAEESIPMWSQYTGNMHGVRIGMREFPFVKKHFLTEQCGAELDSYLELETYYQENKMMFVADQPKLIDVDYVINENLLYPNIITEGTEKDIEKYIRGEPSKIGISLDPIGRYKRKAWEFQKECRYKVFGLPMGVKSLGSAPENQLEKLRELVKRLKDEEYLPPYQSLFLELSEDAIKEMEIIFGPRMTESEELLMQTFLREYGLRGRKSGLRIQ